MTSLVEKSLLIGFGIFTLTIFASTIIPFLGEIANFNQNERSNLELYIIFIDKIDQGIIYLEKNPEGSYINSIDYPANLNTSFYENIVKYEFNIDNHFCVRINEYNHYFEETYYYNILPQKYILNITNCFSLIKVNLI
jgi:hypothetical protein